MNLTAQKEHSNFMGIFKGWFYGAQTQKWIHSC